MSLFRLQFVPRKRGLVTVISVVVLALFFVRPEVQRLRARIVNSIGLALQRPVEASSVTLRFLPQPGFELHDFVVYDDPNFSAEPILRAQEVTAALRVMSLLRGRLEIARLNLSEPSLNLVRNAEGRWNLENLLERAATTPIAPTSKAKTESRPGFPYIEASNARINLKLGQEKKPYALTNSDFALWQDSENTWRMRLKAQPVRTDFNLSDTGLIHLEGSWERAATLRETPLEFTVLWEHAQLGQLSKFISGSDKGWRGGVLLSATLSGKPAALAVTATASVQDFRRYDIMGGGILTLTARCAGQYSSTDFTLSKIDCHAPVSDGVLAMQGNVTGLRDPRAYDLSFTASQVPVQGFIDLVRRCKKGIPEDLVAAGKLQGSVRVHREANSLRGAWEGKGEADPVRLVSRVTNTDLTLGSVPLQIGSTDSGTRSSIVSGETRVGLGPVKLPLGAATPVALFGWFSHVGYNVHLQGDAQVQRLLRAARTAGVPAAQPAAEGTAKIDFQIAGDWSAFAPPQVTGKAQLSSIRAEISGLGAPLEIASANVTLHSQDIAVQNVVVSLAGSTWHGSLLLPRQCPTANACPIHFDFQTKELVSAPLSQALSRKLGQPWYRFLSASQPGQSFLARLNAEGRLSANRILFDKVVATQVSAKVEINQGQLHLKEMEGTALGGKHTGSWDADLTRRPPLYGGKGSIQRIDLQQLAEAMHDEWVTGAGTVDYQVNASGSGLDDLLSSAKATLDVEARDAALTHITLSAEAGPLHVRHFTGRMHFQDSKMEIREGKLETTGGIYKVSGTVSKGRTLNVQLLREGSSGFIIRGTLAGPHVAETTPETQTALKSQ